MQGMLDLHFHEGGSCRLRAQIRKLVPCIALKLD